MDQAGEPRAARIESLRVLGALMVVMAHAFVFTRPFTPAVYEGTVNRLRIGAGLRRSSARSGGGRAEGALGSQYVGDRASYAVLMLVGVPLACAVSLVSYRWIEAPFLRLRRQWGKS